VSIETADGPAFTLARVFDDPKYARLAIDKAPRS
jgi:hypothetical protein